MSLIVNKDGIVRVVHLPSGEKQIIDESRSQHKNKNRAIEVLKSKLYALSHNILRNENVIFEYEFGDNEFQDEIQYLRNRCLSDE